MGNASTPGIAAKNISLVAECGTQTTSCCYMSTDNKGTQTYQFNLEVDCATQCSNSLKADDIVIAKTKMLQIESKMKESSETINKKDHYIGWLKTKLNEKDNHIELMGKETTCLRTTVESLKEDLRWWERKSRDDEERERLELDEEKRKEQVKSQIMERVRIEEEARVRVKHELQKSSDDYSSYSKMRRM